MTRKIDANTLFVEAARCWDAQRHREAFLLFRKAAAVGDVSSQLNVGYFFDVGLGTRRSRRHALHWYRKAVAKGSSSAASNIGTVYRDERRWRLAERWFRRGASMGDGDAYLELAKLYLGPLRDKRKGLRMLNKTITARSVTEQSQEEAELLFRQHAPAGVKMPARRINGAANAGPGDRLANGFARLGFDGHVQELSGQPARPANFTL